MEVDSAFFDPIKEFHPILTVVEMDQTLLEAMLPIRINLFTFVRHPYVEQYGFPIDMPELSGSDLVDLHVKLSAQIKRRGARSVVISADKLLDVIVHKYNRFQMLEWEEGIVKHKLISDQGKEPIVIYDGEIQTLRAVERHINALAIYCNALYHDPKNGKSKLLDSFLSKDSEYTVDNTGRLIGHGALHGRWDYESARDLLFTCIINYIRL